MQLNDKFLKKYLVAVAVAIVVLLAGMVYGLVLVNKTHHNSLETCQMVQDQVNESATCN